MAKILSFSRKPSQADPTPVAGPIEDLLEGFSIEVMPRTADRIEDFRAILPTGSRIYIAHIDGTDFADMLRTAGRLVDQGFAVMPHFPARSIADRGELERMIAAYSDVGVCQALALAGGVARPRGALADSMQLLETGLFDVHGFTHVHVAGHPEGNRDIDPDGGERAVMAALKWKSDFQSRTDARMAIVTQFAFETQPIIDWADRIRAAGVTLPVHIEVAGPAKLHTMIKFAMACGVGPSLRVLQRRAADLSRMMTPFEPTEILTELARHKAANPDFAVQRVHFFPLGGITATTDFAAAVAARAPKRAHA